MLVGSYCVFGVIGFATRPVKGASLPDSATTEALMFSFGPELSGRTWVETEGAVARGWLIRQAFVRGTSDLDSARFSEQVRKIGWPFTTVRGFVRTADGRVLRTGAVLLTGDPLSGPVRFLPIQPVWPGLILNSILITAVLVGGSVLVSPLKGGK